MSDDVQKVVDRLVETLAASGTKGEVARAEEMVRCAGLDVVFELAAAALVSAARHKRRNQTLAAERAATSVKSERAASTPSGAGIRKGTAAYYEWVANTPEGAAYQADEDKYADRMRETMSSAIQKFQEELRIEWTTELLSSTFTLGDGSTVTWGLASIDQHQERADMFARNALANAEGAARHLEAIAAIGGADGQCLADVVGVAA